MLDGASSAVTIVVQTRQNVVAGLMSVGLFAAPPAFAQPRDPSLGEPQPPPISSHYVQYGVGVTGVTVAATDGVCAGGAREPCFLGDGGGLALRVGYRSRSPWYVGGAYEFSRQDSDNLIRLAILQQLRAEARYHWTRATRLSPYSAASVGLAAYGNEWGIGTWGASGSVGLGLEFQITQFIVVHFRGEYRPLLMRRWDDAAGVASERIPLIGIAHLATFEIGFEVREPMARW